jgi:serine/threonine-protein kinase
LETAPIVDADGRDLATRPRAPATQSSALADDLPERYQYLGPIGSGGMGSVHSVRDLDLLRVTALKVMAPSLRDRPEQVQRFLHEAQIMSQLDHPHIVPVHEIGLDKAGNRYFTMKRVHGRNLGDWIASLGRPAAHPQALQDMLGAFLKVCDAVAFAHSRGVLHGDIKPDNIMVGSFGQVYLMDWGVARWLHEPRSTAAAEREDAAPRFAPSLQVVGTPNFMAPEQAWGDELRVDERSDIFALGAVLYNVLFGTPPYQGETLSEVLSKARHHQWGIPAADPTAPIPFELYQILRRAMHRDPRERYRSATELKRAVEEALKGAPLSTQIFPAGSAIVREGSSGDCAYIVLRGRCVAFKTVGGERQVVRYLGEGQVFGEMALLSGGVRTASVEAVDDVVVRVVTRETLNRNLGLETPYGAFVVALAERFRELETERASREDSHPR